MPLNFLLRFSGNISPDPPFQSHYHGFSHWSCFSPLYSRCWEQLNLSDCPMVPGHSIHLDPQTRHLGLE